MLSRRPQAKVKKNWHFSKQRDFEKDFIGLQTEVHSGKLTWLAGKWTQIEDVFPIETMRILQPAMLVLVGGSREMPSSRF